MIEVRTPVHRRPTLRRRRRQRRRRWWAAAVVVLGLLLAGGLLLPGVPAGSDARTPVAEPSPSTPVVPVVPAETSRPVPATSKAVRVNVRGTGKFAYAPGRGKVLGKAGPLRRFRVGVEQGSGEDVAEFAARVEATLGDERSWTGGGRLRLQRVGGQDGYDFTVYLATRETAGRMCARGGVNITVGGKPYTSCRTSGRAIINLDRWNLSAKPFTAAKVPLSTYRHYVINHEVGHELGKRHQGCPKAGGPAPVMVQQTLTLRGCTPYAWPRRANREFTGPAL